MQFSLAETGISNPNMPDSFFLSLKDGRKRNCNFIFSGNCQSKNKRMKDWRHLSRSNNETSNNPPTQPTARETSSLARASQCSGNYNSPGAERNEDHTQMRRSWLRLPFTHSQHQPSPASLNKNQSCLLCMYRVIWLSLSLHGVIFANAISWLNLVDKISSIQDWTCFRALTHTHTHRRDDCAEASAIDVAVIRLEKPSWWRF
jgi:hypothetical protein